MILFFKPITLTSMKKLIATIILWAGLWNFPYAQCIEGPQGGGSFTESDTCVNWKLIGYCGEYKIKINAATVIDTFILLNSNEDTLFKLGIGSFVLDTLPELGISLPLDELPSYVVRGGVSISIEDNLPVFITREAVIGDWLDININTNQPTDFKLIGLSNLSGTTWRVSIPQSIVPYRKKVHNVTLCRNEQFFWKTKQSINNRIWQTPYGLIQSDSILISKPGAYFWETPCFGGDSIIVEFLDSLFGNILVSPIPCSDSVEIVLDKAQKGTSIAWNTGESDLTIKGVEMQNYSFVISSTSGRCSFSRDTMVGFIPSTSVYIPNAFSPNDDGINDCLQVYTGLEVELVDFEFKVFSRWGELIFSTTDSAGCWDGTFKGQEMPPGSYAFVFRNKQCERQGFVTLLR